MDEDAWMANARAVINALAQTPLPTDPSPPSQSLGSALCSSSGPGCIVAAQDHALDPGDTLRHELRRIVSLLNAMSLILQMLGTRRSGAGALRAEAVSRQD